VEAFSKKIKENTKSNFYDKVVGDFSTTGAFEKSASQIVLMHAAEKYFEYEMMMCACGIKRVHMLG